jgi:signal transduction histidine kinase
MRIRTGLFVLPSKEVIAAPFVVDDKVVGVLEIATAKEFSEGSVELLKTVSESIAIAFNSSHARTALQKANDALEKQTLSLAKSEESLKEQRTELQATNEALQLKTAELERQKTEIEHKNIELDSARKGIEKQAEELRAASKYKSEFLANMSHELRTPLNSLLILAQNLSENKDGNLSAKQVEHAKVIHSSGNDLLQLINDILDLSKVEAGQMTIHPEPILLQDFKDRIYSLMAPQAEAKGLAFILILKVDCLPRSSAIRTDWNRLSKTSSPTPSSSPPKVGSL